MQMTEGQATDVATSRHADAQQLIWQPNLPGWCFKLRQLEGAGKGLILRIIRLQTAFREKHQARRDSRSLRHEAISSIPGTSHAA